MEATLAIKFIQTEIRRKKMNNLDIAKITAKHIATIKLVPKSYIKHDCIKITYGFNVLINGKKYPRARGEHYSKSYWQCRGGENAIIKAAIKAFAKDLELSQKTGVN